MIFIFGKDRHKLELVKLKAEYALLTNLLNRCTEFSSYYVGKSVSLAGKIAKLEELLK